MDKEISMDIEATLMDLAEAVAKDVMDSGKERCITIFVGTDGYAHIDMDDENRHLFMNKLGYWKAEVIKR